MSLPIVGLSFGLVGCCRPRQVAAEGGGARDRSQSPGGGRSGRPDRRSPSIAPGRARRPESLVQAQTAAVVQTAVWRRGSRGGSRVAGQPVRSARGEQGPGQVAEPAGPREEDRRGPRPARPAGRPAGCPWNRRRPVQKAPVPSIQAVDLRGPAATPRRACPVRASSRSRRGTARAAPRGASARTRRRPSSPAPADDVRVLRLGGHPAHHDLVRRAHGASRSRSQLHHIPGSLPSRDGRAARSVELARACCRWSTTRMAPVFNRRGERVLEVPQLRSVLPAPRASDPVPGLAAVADPELLQDRRDVVVHGPRRRRPGVARCRRS